MGYRIDYQQTGRKKNTKNRWFSAWMMTAAGCLLLVILAGILSGRGRDVLLELLFPGDAALTVASLDNMVEELKTGIPFSDAFRTFFIQVTAG